MSRLDSELTKLGEIIGSVSLPYEGKSLEVEENGTLILRGVLASTAVDLAREEFDWPSLRDAFKSYFERNPLVVFNHKLNQGIGKLIDAEIKPGNRIEVEAEIPRPPEGDPMERTYNLIRAGVLRAFSIGGRWRKVPMPNGVTKLFTTEVVESSIASGLGMNPDALFSVVGVKSVGGNMENELARLAAMTTTTLDRQLAKLASL